MEKLALIVDDDETLRIVAKRQLRKLGFEVHAAVDGTEAVEACRRTDYQLVLMDIQMPNMDGYEAAREIREIERQNERTRIAIIAVTALQERERALQSGMDECISKPFVFEALKEIVDKCIVSR